MIQKFATHLQTIDAAAVSLQNSRYDLNRAVREIERASFVAEANEDPSAAVAEAKTKLTTVRDAINAALASLESLASCEIPS